MKKNRAIGHATQRAPEARGVHTARGAGVWPGVDPGPRMGMLGSNASQAYGLNEAGMVVGVSSVANGADQDAFLYFQGQMLHLDSLVGGMGLVDTHWARFNWNGDVIGEGRTAAGALRHFQISATAPQDVPEPATLALSGLALLAGIGAQRRRARKS